MYIICVWTISSVKIQKIAKTKLAKSEPLRFISDNTENVSKLRNCHTSLAFFLAVSGGAAAVKCKQLWRTPSAF